MNDFDDIFTEQNPVTPEPEPQETPFDKDKWAADKKQAREKVFALINDAAVELTKSDDALKAYLDIQSRFDRYSVGNALLIASQMPEATKLADFDTWKNADVRIEEGSTAITILEPGKEYKKEDGSTSVFWNTKKVFDVSQTNAWQEAPKVSLDARVMLRALINNAPCKLSLSPTLSDRFNAIYNPDKKEILLRQGLDAPTIFRDLSQELALAHMDDGSFSRSACAFTANCASYILCRRNGVPVDSFGFQHKPEGFASMQGQDVRTELDKIRDVANTISANMQQYLEANNRAQKNKDEKVR